MLSDAIREQAEFEAGLLDPHAIETLKSEGCTCAFQAVLRTDWIKRLPLKRCPVHNKREAQ